MFFLWRHVFPFVQFKFEKERQKWFGIAVILDCRDFALPLSLNGSENSSHSLSQSDAELNQ